MTEAITMATPFLQGVFSGKNAFGGDVQEVGIGALYMTDTTTNYQTS